MNVDSRLSICDDWSFCIRHKLSEHSGLIDHTASIHGLIGNFLAQGVVVTWTAVCQAPLSLGFSRQQHWRELPCLLQGTFPTRRSNSSPVFSALWVESSPANPPEEPCPRPKEEKTQFLVTLSPFMIGLVLANWPRWRCFFKRPTVISGHPQWQLPFKFLCV